MKPTSNFRRFCLVLGATIGLWLAGTLHAVTIFTYQGELNENGNLANGAYDMDFLLWDAVAGGNQVGATITINGVQVTNGRFTVELDFGAAALDNTDRWLEVVVNSTTLVPRQPITRAPYAIQTRGLFVDDDQDVGIGVTNPLYPLHVESDDSVTAAFRNTLAGAGTRHAIVADVLSDDGIAVSGTHLSTDGAAPAILGETHSTAVGATAIRGVLLSTWPSQESAAVRGESRSTNNFGYGVWGSHDGPGIGVYGTSVSVAGVYGEATGGLNYCNYGVYGLSHGECGEGVRGFVDSEFGQTIGVQGWSLSPDGTGVNGLHASSSGTAPGVKGVSVSYSDYAVGVYGTIGEFTLFSGSSSAAVRGENFGTEASGIGVWGSQDGSGFGVYGTTPDGYGVVGLVTGSTGVNYGVYGNSNSPSGYDFYAAGAGVDYGSSSSRRWKKNVANIDHPLDKLAELRGVYFDWDSEHGSHHDVGMIAEEVGKILPEIVQYEENGVDAIGMDYSKLTPLLVEAVKTLRAEKDFQIESQTHRITQIRAEKDLQFKSLQEENNKLHSRLDALEALFSQIEKEDNQ